MEFCLESSWSFSVRLNGVPILFHSVEEPLFSVGRCRSSYNMRLGHFLIDHQVESKINLQIESIEQIGTSQIYQMKFTDEKKIEKLQLKFHITNDGLEIEFPSNNTSKYIRSIIEDDEIIKRDENTFDDSDKRSFWLSLKSLSYDEERIYGGGLQFNCDNHRGKVLPIWVSEWYHDQLHPNDNKTPRPSSDTSYHPQPVFHSSRGYTFCAYGSAYARFDFLDQRFHRLYFSEMPYRLELNMIGLKKVLPLYSSLPEWIHDGIILGVQGGTDVIDEKLCRMNECGTRIGAVWAQDWCGKRVTSFGKRVFWNWQWNENWYPNLKEKIVQWQQKYNGCRFLAYINPYIAVDGSLFKEANENDYLVKRFDSPKDVYLIDFGEFNGAIVDLTNPKAFEWYKKVIEKNLICLGISGWMADFGEYLPCDVHLYANIPGSLMHNLWPILWARCNQQAIRDAQKSNEIFFFMRSGYLNIQRFCPFFWTGDQSVSFSPDTGLPAGIRSSLSLSLSNVLSVHTDIGGYFGREIGRTQEVLLRWCEMEAFNIIMRTHEGNRPTSNQQFDKDSFSSEFVSRMSRIHLHLKPYFREVLKQAFEQGKSTILPYQNLEYFLGNDLLIAPVYQSDIKEWKVSIPHGEWIHIWTNDIFDRGDHQINAPLGYPPVFYRSTTEWKTLFQQLQHF